MEWKIEQVQENPAFKLWRQVVVASIRRDGASADVSVQRADRVLELAKQRFKFEDKIKNDSSNNS